MSNPRYPLTSSTNLSSTKRLGTYLVEAGLLTPAQVEVVLNDQESTGMRFGEIVAVRGWVKEQTIEYLMSKVILPERQADDRNFPEAENPETGSPMLLPGEQEQERDWHPPEKPKGVQQNRKLTWGKLPVSKPLPTNHVGGEEVDWLG